MKWGDGKTIDGGNKRINRESAKEKRPEMEKWKVGKRGKPKQVLISQRGQ